MNTTDTVLDITVSPKSSRTGIVIDENNFIKVYLNSPPVDGAANEECIRLFSKSLKLPKSSITIVKGQKGRKKRISIKGLSEHEVFKMLR